jgi:hypothetical protein
MRCDHLKDLEKSMKSDEPVEMHREAVIMTRGCFIYRHQQGEKWQDKPGLKAQPTFIT